MGATVKRLDRGQRVIIEAQGQRAEGTVLTADNWGTNEKPCWFIEMIDFKDNYRYWKQDQDGGKLIYPKI